jgi:hypothetical protein
MFNQGKTVRCAISTAAMDDLEGKHDVKADQRVDQFVRLREAIEGRASRKFFEGPVGLKDRWFCDPTISSRPDRHPDDATSAIYPGRTPRGDGVFGPGALVWSGRAAGALARNSDLAASRTIGAASFGSSARYAIGGNADQEHIRAVRGEQGYHRRE